MKELKGKIALVTGGSRGIGRAIALALAEEGADVAVNYANNKDAAESVVNEITQKGVRAKAYHANVANAAEVDQMVANIVTDLGTVNILVNSAGITRDRSFLKMSREQWDEVIQTNLTGPFAVTRAILPSLLESGWGRIINISSIVGQQGNFGQTNYSAAKGGLITFTKSLAREVARKNVTVNAVAPGFIETDMTKDLADAVKQQVNALTPVGRMGKPEEIAAAVTFLASPRSSYITGQLIAVNGGMYM